MLTDNWSYIAVDTRRLTIEWERLIEMNDVSREPPMRFALKGGYLAVVKQDLNSKVIQMFDAKSERRLWRSDPENEYLPAPLYQMHIDGETLYGFERHPGLGHYFVALNARTGKQIFRREVKGYDGVPRVWLHPRLHGSYAVARIQDRQDFETRLFDLKKGGAVAHTIRMKGVGAFGVHGRVSVTIQNGRAVMLSEKKLRY